jgi:threonyl-tRNA synthetase
VELDERNEKIGYKIRDWEMKKVPYMLVVGERDMAARVVSPRTREGQQMPAMPLEELAQMLAVQAVPPRIGGPSTEAKASK